MYAKQRCEFMTSEANHAADELFVVMWHAYSEDTMKKCIWDIKTAPEPAVVLTDGQQQSTYNVCHFCTSSFMFGLLTVDPTFCLGDFNVTPTCTCITYRHLLLERRKHHQHPILLGPLLVHYGKTFSSYLFFASSLIGQDGQNEGIKVIGTDDEQQLSNAFLHEFGLS